MAFIYPTVLFDELLRFCKVESISLLKDTSLKDLAAKKILIFEDESSFYLKIYFEKKYCNIDLNKSDINAYNSLSVR